MSTLGPTNVLFDIACQTAATAIAARNSAADVSVVTPLTHGFLQIPFAQGGFGFRGCLTAAKNNSGNITVTVAAPDTPATDVSNPTTSNSDVVNHRPGNLGTLALQPGESTGPIGPIDLYTVFVSGNGNVLHVMGTH